MLISMPTGTSTIFGVFQAIRGLPSHLDEVVGALIAHPKGRTATRFAQGPAARPCALRGKDQRVLQDARRLRLFQQPQQCFPARRPQFLGVECPVLVAVQRIEALLHDGEIFVRSERAVVIRIGCGKVLRA